MHLLAAQPGRIDDGAEAVDPGQAPGDIVVLSAADTELALLADAHGRRPDGAPTLRLFNLMQLGHPMSVDLYVDQVIRRARLVVVRLLGGAGYWAYGLERVWAACSEAGIPLAVLPGDARPDPELDRHCTVAEEDRRRLHAWFSHGGPDNADSFLGWAAEKLGHAAHWHEPVPLVRAGLYHPEHGRPALDTLRRAWTDGAPVAALVFYRALMEAGSLAAVDALVRAVEEAGLNVLPVFTASLREDEPAALVEDLLAAAPPDVILNATGFAVGAPGDSPARPPGPFAVTDAPVLQVVVSGTHRDAWAEGTQGLGPRELAMNVALPEVDGRVLSRAVAFKAEARRDPATQCHVAVHRAEPDRARFTAALAAAWARLRRAAAPERRVAVVLANYPNRDGRLANGVGLDTPESVAVALNHLAEHGYDAGDPPPADGATLMAALTEGPTNAPGARTGGESLSLDAYRAFLDALPETARQAVHDRWGPPENDPFVQDGAFVLPVARWGNTVVAVQPARGYNIDPQATYHSPDLVPPHGYLAFYAWMRRAFDAHAVVHFGKHGNLEWLPGKALALSETCWPEIALGPLPHLYPFIVNDPGEGTQAKRRAQAVVLDHLTPPLTRAETYGPVKELEHLVDEYFEAAGMDPRRLDHLRADILSRMRTLGLDRDMGVDPDRDEESALAALDEHLCGLKELQIRDGLHVFGRSPDGDRATDLLVALARLPRGEGAGNESLLRALARDLDLPEGFDPLDCDMGAAWTGPYPESLQCCGTGPWRTQGDTVERLEALARALVAGRAGPHPAWETTRAVLDAGIRDRLRPAVEASGPGELAGLVRGLDGRFVPPGPSGAPTRGRPDVLPTGRNFYSVDGRGVPTPAAWHLGWKSAQRLVVEHFQEHGEPPRALVLSAWGTANMRTGGDDIAQALALLGVRPTWDAAARRVTGFEILPVTVLDRPRVDVTFRVSGFFRDAFPAQMDLMDSAARAVADLDESPDDNPLAARVAEEAARLENDGTDADTARRRAGSRVFGAQPGAYGAGLQALMDEGGWQDDADLAGAYVAWGGWAYGGGTEGAAAQADFRHRLAGAEAVVHNQDNREHDLLDSDDYYQFEGGATAAVRHLSGAQPTVYHNDHSRPESPRVRNLKEEIGRVVRGRAANPRWIAGVMRHGYKGAFEMAATVDYLFAFAATARVVENHHFDQLFDAYLDDAEVRDFIAEHNPAALKEMAERFREALDRGLWRPASNRAPGLVADLAEGEAGG